MAGAAASTQTPAPAGLLQRVGRRTLAAAGPGGAVLALVGEITLALLRWLRHPGRVRWRQVLFNIRSAGVDALPIVGLLVLLLGVVVAYQSANQLLSATT